MAAIGARGPTTSDLAIGIMSGTSADGVDAALVEIRWRDGSRPSVDLVAHLRVPYERELRERVLDAAAARPATAADLARLHAALGDAYADAATAIAADAPAKPAAIGVHGQTVAHLPGERATFQLGDAARVAVRTGIATVNDFRSADIAAGGEGAPLTPFADHVLFADGTARAILNLGGIANLTLLPDRDPEHVLGYDTGPANMVIDGVARLASLPFDESGRGARRGRVVDSALSKALAHPFFARPAPKSTGREEFGEAFARALVDDISAAGGSLEDALATATELTARSVALSLRAAGGSWREVLVAGGGTRNPALMEALARALEPVAVRATDEAGLPAAAREAVAFAILAAYRMRGLPNTLPRCTGASRAVSAGAIHAP